LNDATSFPSSAYVPTLSAGDIIRGIKYFNQPTVCQNKWLLDHGRTTGIIVMASLLILLAIFHYVAVFSSCLASGQAWNGLRVTWSANPFSSWGYDSMPRNEHGSMKQFTLKDDQCAPGSKFLGKRYWYKEDPAVMLLYDKNGYIAGIQTAIPKGSLTPSSFQANHPMIDDGDYWTITAYFIEPSKICSTGRTEAEFNDQGTGTGLWLQNGTNPINDVVRIPLTESEIRQTKWKFGHCFYTMGNHYWFDVTRDMDCGQLYPSCLMYNGGKLTAFCFAVTKYLSSNRYEHPTPKDAEKFLDPVPTCLYNSPEYSKLSTIHVYMIDSPRTQSWC